MKIFNITILVLILASCATSSEITKPSPAIRVYAGAQKGGIIENTDLIIVDEATPDAYSGATSTGFLTGIHYEYYTSSLLSLESGLDLTGNSQEFKYSDNILNFDGTRKLFTTQLRVPITVNFRFLQKANPDGIIKLKLGISPGLSFINELSTQGRIPAYSTRNFSIGPSFGLEICPFGNNKNLEPSLYFSLFRSTQGVYHDIYQEGDMPGLSYMSFGVSIKIR